MRIARERRLADDAPASGARLKLQTLGDLIERFREPSAVLAGAPGRFLSFMRTRGRRDAAFSIWSMPAASIPLGSNTDALAEALVARSPLEPWVCRRRPGMFVRAVRAPLL